MPISVMLKPASSNCNLACEYCFYHSLSSKRTDFSKGFMSDDTAKRVVAHSMAMVVILFLALHQLHHDGAGVLVGSLFQRGKVARGHVVKISRVRYLGQIVVEDMGQLFDVQPPGGDVSGHQGPLSLLPAATALS